MRCLDSLPKEIPDEVDSQLATADEAVDDRIRHLEATTLTRVTALASRTHVFKLWQLRIESSFDGIYTDMEAICSEIEQIGLQVLSCLHPSDGGTPGILGTPGSVMGRSPAIFNNSDGSRFRPSPEIFNWDSGNGYNLPNFRSPVTGAWNSPSSILCSSCY